jgi:hypothetical protein
MTTAYAVAPPATDDEDRASESNGSVAATTLGGVFGASVYTSSAVAVRSNRATPAIATPRLAG